MNKLICKYHKAKGSFKRAMCGICAYSSRCIDYDEYINKHDERRDFIQQGSNEQIQLSKS